MGSNHFRLWKVLLVAMGRCNLYGMDSSSGAVVWQGRVEGRSSALHIQRDGRTPSEASLASLHFVWSFNPIRCNLFCPKLIYEILFNTKFFYSDLDTPIALIAICSVSLLITSLFYLHHK